MPHITIPKDPVILLSFINTKLRDFHGSLDDLCLSLGLEKKELCDKLLSIDYFYDPDQNQFI